LNQETEQIETIRQYLLGRLPEDKLTTLDERVVTDPAFHEELLIVEDELIDEYLAGELSADESRSFEDHFLLTSERREKLRFGRAFSHYFSRSPAPALLEPVPKAQTEEKDDVPVPPPKWYERFLPIKNPILAYSLMAVALLVVAGVSWLAVRNRTPRLSGPVYAITITAGTTRGANDSGNRFSIPPGIGTVELKAELRQDEYPRYSAVLFDDAGSELWRETNLQTRSDSGPRVLVVPVPARLLVPGYYSLKLSGITPEGKNEDLPTYRFHVIL
jgi:hypothetical protein